eukprot:scaffold12908_cov88-Skeletonema_marinoi.AAC.1
MDPPAVDKYLSRSSSTSSASRLWRSSKNAPVTSTVRGRGERQRLNYHCSQQTKQNVPTSCYSSISITAAPKGRSRRLERIFCSIIIYTIMSFFVLVYLDLDGGGGKRVQHGHNPNNEDDLMEEVHLGDMRMLPSRHRDQEPAFAA